MADDTVSISFNDDPFTDARGDTATYTGTIDVDQTAGTYPGNVKVEGRGLGAGIGLSGHLASDGSAYTVSRSNLTFGYAGQQPATAVAEFAANNDQDSRTSLNPSGRRNRPVTSSGDAGTTQAARTDAASTAATPHAADATASGQTPRSGAADVFANRGAPPDASLFDPGHGGDVVRPFHGDGGDYGTLGFAASGFGHSIAEALLHGHTPGDGVVTTDPADRDTLRLPGVGEAELAHEAGGSAFRA